MGTITIDYRDISKPRATYQDGKGILKATKHVPRPTGNTRMLVTRDQ